MLKLIRRKIERNISIPAIEKPGTIENGCGKLDEAEETGHLGGLVHCKHPQT